MFLKLEKEKPSTENSMLVKLSLKNEGEIKIFPDKFRIKNRDSNTNTHIPMLSLHCIQLPKGGDDGPDVHQWMDG